MNQQDMKGYIQMGFPESLVLQANQISQKNQNKEFMDILLQLQEQQKQKNNQYYQQQQQQQQRKKSSLDDMGEDQYQKMGISRKGSQVIQQEEEDEILSIDQRIRQSGIPVGLRNRGNTCYFNSLIQSYFYNPLFLERVMSFKYPTRLDLSQVAKSEAQVNRINASINLVLHLQRLFSFMIFTHKKYADPIQVLNNIFDDLGNKVIIGEEKDIGEFNLNFLERIEEGLQYCDNLQQPLNNRSAENMFGTPQKNAAQIDDTDLLSDIDFSQNQNKINQINNNHSTLLSSQNSNASSTQLGESTINTQNNSNNNNNHQTELLLSSGKKKKVSLGQKDQMVSSMFYGTRKEYIIYNKDQKDHQSESSHLFSPIILDLQYKNLYNSWEEYNSFTVEDFRTDDIGNKTDARKEIWMTQVPKNLMFQIQRVVYDKKIGQTRKLNDKFTFEKEIYIDRFLLKNREYIMQSKPKLEKLRAKKLQIEKELTHFENFKNSNTGILKLLQNCMSYLIETKTGWIQEEEDDFDQKSMSSVESHGQNKSQSPQITQKINSQNQIQQQDDLDQIGNDLLSLHIEPSDNGKNNNNHHHHNGSSDILHTPNKKRDQSDNNNMDNSNSNGRSQQMGSSISKKQSMDISQLENGMLDFTEEEKITHKQLTKLKTEAEIKVQNLRKELKTVNSQIDQIFSCLKDWRYTLHAILIHEGASESGHYYAFIYQRGLKKWYKYSDIFICEVSEENVLKIAFGQGNQSAYCLMYLSEAVIQHALKYNFQQFSNIDKRQFDKSLFFSIVPKNIKEEIEKENIRLQNLSKIQKIQEQGDLVITNYTNRFEFINAYVRKNKNSSKVMLINQAAYIKQLCESEEPDSQKYKEILEIFKWSILDTAIQEECQGLTLVEAQKEKILFERIMHHFSNMTQFKAPQMLKVQKNDFTQLNHYSQQYVLRVQSVVALTFAITQVSQLNWIEALYGLQKIINLNKYTCDYFYNLGGDVLRVVLIKIGCSLFEMAGNESSQKIYQLCDYVLVYVKLLPKNDTTQKQMSLMMLEFMRYFGQKIFDSGSQQILNQKIRTINEQTHMSEFKSYFEQEPQELEDLISEISEGYKKNDWKINDNNEYLEKQIKDKMLMLKNQLKEFIEFHKTLKLVGQQPLTIEQRIKQGYQVNTLF